MVFVISNIGGQLQRPWVILRRHRWEMARGVDDGLLPPLKLEVRVCVSHTGTELLCFSMDKVMNCRGSYGVKIISVMDARHTTSLEGIGIYYNTAFRREGGGCMPAVQAKRSTQCP